MAHIAASCLKGGNKNLYAMGEKASEINEEAVDNEEELQAWCLLEESEHEPWQEVIRKREKQKLKNVAKVPLTLENNQSSSSEGHKGESQSHIGLWSCSTCHA